MKKMKKAVALALSAAMATSGAQFTSLGSLKVDAAPNISRVSVHDPSIFEDNGKYYVFGSHIATAASTDLMNWTQVSTDYQSADDNVIYGNVKENLKESFKWAGYDDGDCKGGYAVWAPDVIYNPSYVWEDGSKGAYMLYYSASSTWRRSCIGYLVSKTVDGGYQYGGTVVYSGFTNTGKVNYDGNSTRDTTWTNDYLPFNDLIKEKKIDGDASTWKCFNPDGSWNNNYAPNAIDPTVFFDATGEHLYMVYGSWSGGLFILEIDKETGEAIYPGEDGIEPTSGNVVDRYFGVHIAGGNHQSGEGPYIVYDKNTGYYYMYETYGGLTTTGGYNMRLFRSKNVYGPYVDAAGNEAQNSGVNCYKYGTKLIGNYQFYGQPGYRAAGHNSALITEDGKYYNVFHQRFLDPSVGEYHEVRVRQQFLNEDDWLVTAVYENKNEAIQKYTADEVVGTYEFINHGNAEKSGEMLNTETVILNEDGTITGDEEGTWTMADAKDYIYVTLNIDGATYKGVFFRQTNDNDVQTMTFTAIGNNNLAVWGSKFDASDEVLGEKVATQLESMLPEATRDDIELPTTLSGATITWASDNEAIISATGKVGTPSEDTEVTLTATITYGTATITKEFKVKVYDGPSIIAGYDFDNVDGSSIAPTSAAQLRDTATLKGDASVVTDDVRGEVLKVENAAGNKQVNYLSLPNDVFKNIDKSGYTVSMWVNVGEKTFIHSALFEADHLNSGDKTGNYPMTRIGANLIGRINADGYSDAVPDLNYSEFTGKWQLVTYTVNTNGIKVFLNGNQIVYDKKDISTCFSGDASDIMYANHVMVGAGDIWGDEDCQAALFDDVRIYDTALTNSEVKSLYDATYIEEKTTEPEEKERTIDEEEPAVEGMTKGYIKLDNEEFFEGANVYVTDEDGNAVCFGEMPGKSMAHIGNGWYSVNIPNDIIYSDEDKDDEEELTEEDVTEEELQETEETSDDEKSEDEVASDTEKQTEKADEDKTSEEVTDESKSAENENKEEAQENTESTDTESLVDEVKEVITSFVSSIKSAFAPIQAKAAEHQNFVDGIHVAVNNGNGFVLTDVNEKFTFVRPTAEELNQTEAESGNTEEPLDPEKPGETVTPEQPAPQPQPSESTTPVAPTTGSDTSSNTGSTSGSNASNSSSSGSSSSTSTSTASIATAGVSAVTPVTPVTQIADAQVPLAASTDSSVKAASQTTKSSAKTASKKSDTTAVEDAEDEAEASSEDEKAEEEATETLDKTETKADEAEVQEIQDEDTATAYNEEAASNNSGLLAAVAIIIVVVAAASAGVLFLRKRKF